MRPPRKREDISLDQATQRLATALRSCSEEISTTTASVALVSVDVQAATFVITIGDDAREFVLFTPLLAQEIPEELLAMAIRDALSSDERRLDIALGGLAEASELEHGQ